MDGMIIRKVMFKWVLLGIYEHCYLITIIDCSNCSYITTIDQLKHLTNLQELYMNNCTGITDITPLSNLTNLQELYMNFCTGITDITT